MGKVIDFETRQARCSAEEPDAEIIAVLEKFLEAAKSGRLQSLVAVGVDGFGRPEGAMTIAIEHGDVLCDRLRFAADSIASLGNES